MSFMDAAQLKGVLVDTGIIPQEEFDKYVAEANIKGCGIDEVLYQNAKVTEEVLTQAVANSIKVPYIDLSSIKIPDTILHIIPEKLAVNEKIIAFKEDSLGLHIALFDPNKKDIIDLLKKKVEQSVIIYIASKTNIENALNQYQHTVKDTFDKLLTKNLKEITSITHKDSRTIEIVNSIIKYAYSSRASDIHVEPTDEDSIVRFRIDGSLKVMASIPKDIHNQIITRIKILSKLQTDEHMAAQDGKMQFDVSQEVIDIRVSIVPIVSGEKVVMRLLSSKSRKLALIELGLQGDDLKKIQKAYAQPNGMILSTGPTGSGKTTSIYSILQIVNSQDINISTIEDPVEYVLYGVNQIQVNPKTNLTFADGLRSLLRQDPDIIFVGEIRDSETAQIAANSALTGHLVLSTLHTNDAATALPRLIDMGVEPFVVASTVNVIIAQRLVRKICENCKTSKSVNSVELKEILDPKVFEKYFKGKDEIRMYLGEGCEICGGTGFQGRIGVFEVLEISNEIKNLIVNKANSEEIIQLAINQGMSTMFEDGMKKVAMGYTTIEELTGSVKAMLGNARVEFSEINKSAETILSDKPSRKTKKARK